jgi:hypothetical protein
MMHVVIMYLKISIESLPFFWVSILILVCFLLIAFQSLKLLFAGNSGTGCTFQKLNHTYKRDLSAQARNTECTQPMFCIIQQSFIELGLNCVGLYLYNSRFFWTILRYCAIC